MTLPHFKQLAGFMESGGMDGPPEFAYPESMNVEELCEPNSNGTKDYTITYFEFHGRASVLCFMCHKANASWFKKALTFPEWGELKKKQGGGLPVVTLADGTMLSESIPTAKFMAKKLGYYPEDALLAHRCDYTVNAFTEAYFGLFDAI